MNYLAFHKEMTMGKFHHAYLFSFSGKKEDYDDYLAEMGIKALVDHLISQDSRQFNYVVYYGHDAESLTETLFTPPMFGDKRVTVVKQAHKLTGTPLDAVERYVKKPPSDGHLVLQAGDVDKRKSFYKKVYKLIDLVNCAKLNDNEIRRWITRYVKKFGKEVDSKAIELLSSINWPGMRELVSELDQLVLLIGEKPIIELPDVQEMGGGSFAFERWTLSNAIGSGDTELALEAARKLYLLKVEPTQIIGDLFRVFRQLWMLRWYIDKNQLNRARKSIRVPTDVFNKLSANARRVSRLRLEDGILLLLEADLNIKRGIRAGDLEISVLIGSLVKLIHRE